MIREKIVLRRRTSPKQITLPKGTTFIARCERINREQLPINIHVKKTRKIGPQNRNKSKNDQDLQDLRELPKKVRFTPSTSLRERLARIKRFRVSRKGETGSGLASNLAKIGLIMGSKTINFALRKKQTNKRIESKGISNFR